MTMLKEKFIKSCRKEHRCKWCGGKIKKNETAYYRSYVFEGEFNHGWMHNICYKAMMESDKDDLCEGWYEGMWEFATTTDGKNLT